MAVDTNSLAYLIDPFWQGEGINGKPLVAGYMCVYIAGTDIKYITYQNFDGTRNPFKIPLGSDGRATILAEVQNTYDCYLYDSFGNMVCSRLNVSPVIGGGNIEVSGLTQVFHDDTLSGDGTSAYPLGVEASAIENMVSGKADVSALDDMMSASQLDGVSGIITAYHGSAFSAGSTYSGIAPIHVDNEEKTISVDTKDFIVNAPLELTETDSAYELSLTGNINSPRTRVLEWGVSNWDDVKSALDDMSAGDIDYIVAKYVDGTDTIYAPLSRVDSGEVAVFVSPSNKSESVYGLGTRQVTDIITISTADMWVDRMVRPFHGKLIGSGSVHVAVNGEDYVVSGDQIPQSALDAIDRVVSSYSAWDEVSAKKDKQSPYSFTGTNRQTVNTVSQNENGDVSVNNTKVVGSEYTVVHAGSTSNKFAKIAEFKCYSGFSYVGSGFTNLVVTVSDAGGARQATISVGITQAANGNHNFAAPLRYYVSVNQSSTMELKAVYLFSDTPYGDNQTQATISLWAEFTDLSQKQWTFKAENNFATPGTGGTPKANAWEFANGQRYAVSELPTGGWQLNSQTPTYATETPDWDETTPSARSFIRNKPDLSNTLNASGFEYSGSVITGYSGSAFAGGGGGASYTGNVQEALDEVYSASGSWNNVSSKLDSTAFNSGDFYPMTGNPSGFITDAEATAFQPISGMTSYQFAGDYYSASNPSGFLDKASADTLYASAIETLPFSGRSGVRVTGDNGVVYVELDGSINGFPAEIKTGTTAKAVVTTGFQDNTATRPTLFISSSPTQTSYPRMLLSENHAAAQTSKSGAFLADAFEFYTGKNGGSTKVLRVDSTGMSGNAGFVFNKANYDKWNSVYNTVNTGSGSWTGGGSIPEGTMNVSGLEYDSNNNISGYSGSAFAGGRPGLPVTGINGIKIEDDGSNIIFSYTGENVPTGVMTESALEYNAVNEISGYNGSAIAQYGAEKQWLQHDDTLLHVANSAQYALGVNVSAVAQLMGVDETVLWEGEINTTAQSAQLSEALSGFNSVKFYAHRMNNPIGRGIEVQEFVPTWNMTNRECYFYCLWTDMASNTIYQNMMYISAKDDVIGFLPGWRKEGTTENTGITAYGFRIEKVVGIGRKEV